MLVTDQKEKKDWQKYFSASPLFREQTVQATVFSSNGKWINYDNTQLQIKNLLSTMRKSKENMILTISKYFYISYISEVHKASEYL